MKLDDEVVGVAWENGITADPATFEPLLLERALHEYITGSPILQRGVPRGTLEDVEWS